MWRLSLEHGPTTMPPWEKAYFTLFHLSTFQSTLYIHCLRWICGLIICTQLLFPVCRWPAFPSHWLWTWPSLTVVREIGVDVARSLLNWAPALGGSAWLGTVFIRRLTSLFGLEWLHYTEMPSSYLLYHPLISPTNSWWICYESKTWVFAFEVTETWSYFSVTS